MVISSDRVLLECVNPNNSVIYENQTESEIEMDFLYSVIKVFFLKFLEDMSPFCGATNTPVSDFW